MNSLSPDSVNMLGNSLASALDRKSLESELSQILTPQSFVAAFQGLSLSRVFEVPAGVSVLLEDRELFYYGSRIGSEVHSVAEYPPGHLTLLMDLEGKFFAAGLGILDFVAHDSIQLMNRVARDLRERREKATLAVGLLAEKGSKSQATLALEKIAQENLKTLERFLQMGRSEDIETRREGFNGLGQLTYWDIAVGGALVAGLQDTDESVSWNACAAVSNLSRQVFFDRRASLSKCMPFLVERFLFSSESVSRLAGLALSANGSHSRPYMERILNCHTDMSTRRKCQVVAILGQFEDQTASEQKVLVNFSHDQSPNVAEMARLVLNQYQKSL